MPERSAEDWQKDSQRFDTIANLYDTYRPDYPTKLVDSVVTLSGIPWGGNILEIGSGTGKATILFAQRGYTIHCIEPGPNLVSVATRNLQAYPRVTFEISRFEESRDHTAEFDLVMAASAFHWISGEVGYQIAARALKPLGSLALFWNMSTGFQGKITQRLAAIYREIVPELTNSPKHMEEIIEERHTKILQSGCFNQVTIRRFHWSRTYRTEEYLGLLNTHSDHLRLEQPTRQKLSDAIGSAIDKDGGTVKRKYMSVLYVAKKLG